MANRRSSKNRQSPKNSACFASDFEHPNDILHFFSFDIESFEKRLSKEPEEYWRNKGVKKALDLFHAAAKRVPAYKDFLKKHRVHPGKIKTIRDFQSVPITDKKNYIEKYSLPNRMWDGRMPNNGVIAASSGTTGTPKFWPRSFSQEFEAAVLHELIYRNFFHISHLKTLLIVGFPVGLNVSGMATVFPSYLVAARGYPLTVAPIGTNKAEILRVLEATHDSYDQVILAAHPFFAKDIMESYVKSGAKKLRVPVRFLFASEAFGETWREYLLSFSTDVHATSAMSVYGCADMLLVGTETPLSIKIKRLAENDQAFALELFQRPIVPALFQYNPLLRYAESINGKLLFTSASGAPLVRFSPGDTGTVIAYEDVLKKTTSIVSRKNLFRGILDWKLPFIMLHGRSDFTLPFYFAFIDPIHIKLALEHSEFFGKITGKFTLRNPSPGSEKQTLEIHIELGDEVKGGEGLRRSLGRRVTQSLRERDYRYEYMCSVLKKHITPKVTLWPYKHDKYFKAGQKPKYISET